MFCFVHSRPKCVVNTFRPSKFHSSVLSIRLMTMAMKNIWEFSLTIRKRWKTYQTPVSLTVFCLRTLSFSSSTFSDNTGRERERERESLMFTNLVQSVNWVFFAGRKAKLLCIISHIYLVYVKSIISTHVRWSVLNHVVKQSSLKLCVKFHGNLWATFLC